MGEDDGGGEATEASVVGLSEKYDDIETEWVIGRVTTRLVLEVPADRTDAEKRAVLQIAAKEGTRPDETEIVRTVEELPEGYEPESDFEANGGQSMRRKRSDANRDDGNADDDEEETNE